MSCHVHMTHIPNRVSNVSSVESVSVVRRGSMGHGRRSSHTWALLVLGGLASGGVACRGNGPGDTPETTTNPASNEDPGGSDLDAARPERAADAAPAPLAPDAGGVQARADCGVEASLAIDPQPARVTIEEGELEGMQLPGHVRSFLGIPYAEPPVGELRFAAPQPKRAWSSRLDATAFGPRCAQLAAARWQTAASSDEDCLYLNVWSPAQRDAPVLVFLHGADGGSGAGGSASEPAAFGAPGWQYDGEQLAREQGLVVVTLDYRLGVFGFLAHRALANGSWRLGNQSLWDQRLALAWVKKNIAAFGGDPLRVTLFGQAGGARDVCLHMASPESRGLFQRAIGHSAGCTTRQAGGDEAMRLAESFARRAGCGAADEGLACLRAKSADELLAASVDVASFGPLVDGQFLPDQPRALFDAGDIAKVPYLLGSNSDEGSLLLSGEPPLLSAAELKAAITRYFSTPAASVAQRYPLSNFARDPNPYQAALARILGDASFVCTTYDTALRAARAGANVYLFNFDVPLTVAGMQLGASHGAELSFVFGSRVASTEGAQRVRESMQAYWSQFAASGDPNADDRADWPAFTPASDRRLNLGATIRVIDAFRADECNFWRGIYDNTFTIAGATTH